MHPSQPSCRRPGVARGLWRGGGICAAALAAGCKAPAAGAPPPTFGQLIGGLGHWLAGNLWLLVLLAGCVACVVAIVRLRRVRAVRKGRAAALRQAYPEPERAAVGPCLEMLYGDDLDARARAATTLVRQLPLLTPADAGSLSRHQVRNLLRTLRYPESYLVCAAIRGLTALGEPDALRDVEALAQFAPTAQILDTARDCLPRLRQRIAERRAHATLLRSAAAQDDEPLLLRPAAGAPDRDAAALLRPSAADEMDSGARQ